LDQATGGDHQSRPSQRPDVPVKRTFHDEHVRGLARRRAALLSAGVTQAIDQP